MISELFSIHPVYSVLAFVLAMIFVAIGFKVAKWLFWILAFLLVVLSFLMVFVF